MLKQSLSQKMLQKLSPQQIQLMKLLQIPTASLDQRIEEELESNPALEEGDDYDDVFDLENDAYGETEAESEREKEEPEFEFDDYLNEYLDDDPSSYKMKGEDYLNEDEKSMPIPVENSFHESLEKQLGMLDLNETNTVIAKQIIGSIDEDGYLRREPLSMVDDLLFAYNIETTLDDVNEIIKRIQKFDPAGICARTLQECLILQLEDRMDKEPDIHITERRIALRILNDFFEEFTKKHYIRMKKQLNLADGELKDAIDEIIKLNPKPASTVESNQLNQYIIPDFIIHNRDGELELNLNSKNAPDLRINDQYMEMLKGYRETVSGRRATKPEKEAVLFIKQKIDSAKWFIDAIKQRQDTLYRTMYAIMQYQYDYFSTGDERRIKPMILKDLAEVTGLDISTVSRVANSKFVQTEFGTKKLKDFFSESMQAQDGSEVSTLEIKTILSDEVSREDKTKPLSDERLMEILSDRGYNIARRTIAKYREQLNIPVARLRKELR